MTDSMTKHPAGKQINAEDRALREAEKWSKAMKEAHEGYEKALLECRQLGVPNTVVAHRLGKSEAAIRMYLSRKAKVRGVRR